MNISERAREFLSRTQVCVPATTGPGNSPHAVPMWYRYRYRDGVITISTWRESRKCRNVERTGKAMVVVDRRDPPYYAGPNDVGRGRHVCTPGDSTPPPAPGKLRSLSPSFFVPELRDRYRFADS